jgi:histone H3/H4
MRTFGALALLVVAVALASSPGCATYGATLLPPGAAGASFLDEAKGTVPLTGAALHLQRALDDAARAHVEKNAEVLEGLRASARALRQDLAAGARDLVAEDGRETMNVDDIMRVRDIARRYLELDALLYALWTS